MFGRNCDLIFFFAPLLLAMALYAVLQSHVLPMGVLFLIVTNGLGLNQLHLGPSWFFYLDKENRKYWLEHKNKAWTFFAGPPLVILITTLLYLVTPWLVYVLFTAWGIQHFVAQNIGFLVLYHNKANNEAIAPRVLQSRSLWAGAYFFSAFYVEKVILKGQPSIAFNVIAALLAVWLVFNMVLYVRELSRQMDSGARLNVPGFAFWVMSVFYFAPFALLNYDEKDAFMVPGVLHWTQYLCLNYMLVKYKYVDERKSLLPPGGAMTWFWGLAWAIFIVSFCMHAEKLANAAVAPVLIGALMGISNAHYFQDAFLWRFREQYQRDSIMPYIFEARRRGNEA